MRARPPPRQGAEGPRGGLCAAAAGVRPGSRPERRAGPRAVRTGAGRGGSGLAGGDRAGPLAFPLGSPSASGQRGQLRTGWAEAARGAGERRRAGAQPLEPDGPRRRTGPRARPPPPGPLRPPLLRSARRGFVRRAERGSVLCALPEAPRGRQRCCSWSAARPRSPAVQLKLEGHGGKWRQSTGWDT